MGHGLRTAIQAWSPVMSRSRGLASADRYREERVDVVRAIEQTVIGGDLGANGYTTVAQADRLATLLGLDVAHAPDVGAGRGWPGLYLARRPDARWC